MNENPPTPSGSEFSQNSDETQGQWSSSECSDLLLSYW